MTDQTRPDDPARIPEEPPESFGNTIDGSGAGDGSTSRGGDEADTATGSAATGSAATEPATDRAAGGATPHDSAGAASSAATSGAGGDGAAERAEQKKVYQTPEQPDHAVGGSDGTADGQ